MIAADGIKLAELRARAAGLEDMTKDLQKKLMSARMEEGKALDPNEKSKLQKKSIDIQMEWTRRGLDLKKLRDEIAALEGKAAPAASVAANAPPVIPKSRPEKTSPNFEDADNVAVVGNVVRSFKAPNPIACREACEADATCAGYQHGKKAANMGQCELFSAITARNEDQSWRSGVRRVTSSGASMFRAQPTRSKLGFDFYEDLDFEGDQIKAMTVDSADGCMTVCRNTRDCSAAALLSNKVYTAQFDGHNCVVYRKVLKLRGAAAGVTAIVKREP